MIKTEDKEKWGEEPRWLRKPKKIRAEFKSNYCQCTNCKNIGEVTIIHYSVSDYELPSGKIGKGIYAKERELWLCNNCLNQLREAIR